MLWCEMINATTATWGHLPYKDAMERLQDTVDPFLGKISTKHVQLCPQNPGMNNINSLLELKDLYPDTSFRLHADVKVIGRVSKADLCWYTKVHNSNWTCIAAASNALQAPCYSLHAGERNCTFNELLEKYYQLQELFDCPIAIEGHYPAGNNRYHLATWEDHEILLNSGAKFVVDLSHFNIIATRYGWQDDLVYAMLQHENCLEVHVSSNGGKVDAHEPLLKEPYWWKYMSNVKADIFYEGNHSIIELRKNNPNFGRNKNAICL